MLTMTSIQCEEENVPVDSMDELLRYVMGTRNFTTQRNNLANHFGISDGTSASLLLEQVYERLKNKQLSDVTPNELSWLVTWSEKDCERDLFKDVQWYQEEVLDAVPYKTIEGTRVVPEETLKVIFPDKRSREFVQSVLEFGKEETMQKYHLSKHQFNSRLNHRIHYLDKHQDVINRIVNTDQHKLLVKQQQVVHDLLTIIGTPTLSDEVINSIVHEAFTKYPFMTDYLDQATTEYQLKYQAKVVNDFMNGKYDTRLFISFLYKRANQLDTLLNEDDNH